MKRKRFHILKGGGHLGNGGILHNEEVEPLLPADVEPTKKEPTYNPLERRYIGDVEPLLPPDFEPVKKEPAKNPLQRRYIEDVIPLYPPDVEMRPNE